MRGAGLRRSALHDGEQVLLLARAKRALAALGPAKRELHRLANIGLAWRRQRGALVQLHDDVGADQVGLDFDRALGREAMLDAVDVARNVTPSASSLRSCARLHHLIAAAIGEDRAIPAHESCKPPRRESARRLGGASDDRCCPAGYRLPPGAPDRPLVAFTVPAVPTGMKAGVRIGAARGCQHAGARRAVRGGNMKGKPHQISERSDARDLVAITSSS